MFSSQKFFLNVRPERAKITFILINLVLKKTVFLPVHRKKTFGLSWSSEKKNRGALLFLRTGKQLFFNQKYHDLLRATISLMKKRFSTCFFLFFYTVSSAKLSVKAKSCKKSYFCCFFSQLHKLTKKH